MIFTVIIEEIYCGCRVCDSVRGNRKLVERFTKLGENKTKRGANVTGCHITGALWVTR